MNDPMPSFEPMTPVSPPTTPTNAKTAKPRGAHAAWACLIAPWLAISLGFAGSVVTGGSRSAAVVTGVVQGVILLIGIGAGLFALTGIRRHTWFGILGRVIPGLLVTALIVWIFASAMSRALAQKDKLVQREAEQAAAQVAAQEREAARVNQEATESFLLYPGWFGVLDLDDTSVVVASFDDASPTARMFNRELGMNISPAQIVVENFSPTESVVFDAADCVLRMKDDTVVPCLPLTEVLESAVVDREQIIAIFSGPFTVAPQSPQITALVFTPFGFDWNEVDSVSFLLSGETVTVEGWVLTPEEKADMGDAE